MELTEKLTSTAHFSNTIGDPSKQSERMLFTGPVFIGYDAESVRKILKSSGWATN